MWKVVLDLDETLVCAYETSSLPPIIRTRAEEAGVKCFELECFSSEKDVEGKPDINHVTVFERPGLKEFLKQIGEFADLILFTAGSEGYASPLFDRIDVENRFSQRLFRPSTVSTEYRELVKDLSCLSKTHPCKRMLGLYFTRGSTCLNGFKCMAFLLLL
uniref:Mitochondrial import inner membrane translocase subunit TIM50 n=2 Tax=Populus TaxID=3689 RepID=A0A4U5P458_POPAL|nr:hypothetical protein D5086_0000236040 [Populus alba]